jgi:hypothetical protein
MLLTVEDEEIGEFWATDKLLKLFDRMEKVLPSKDKHKFEKAAEKLDWEGVSYYFSSFLDQIKLVLKTTFLI